MGLAYLLIAFFTSLVGAICGIGGGVIIKPTLDMMGTVNLQTANFLSSCTVISMALVSVGTTFADKRGDIDTARSTPLATGAVLGGVAGGRLFSLMWIISPDVNTLGVIQSMSMLLLTVAVIIYTLLRDRGRVALRNVNSKAICLAAGLALGVVSGFLGIGAGPFNLMVLSWLFSMENTVAVKNSLYIILLSQIANLCGLFISKTIPAFDGILLSLMIFGGILGGMAGRAVNKRIGDRAVSRLFIGLMVGISALCAYNVLVFWQGIPT